jgi:gliding motility-associated-like protein
MKNLWIILFLSSFVYSQQEIKLCEQESVTITYSVESNIDGNNEWEVNGEYFYSDSLTMTWSDIGTYVINVVTYSNGCPSEPQSLTVYVLECDDQLYWVPNTFTPDDDEFNQTFKPIITSGIDPFNYHLTIFNRWGEIIFESFDISKGWDGKYGNYKCQDGVYVWKIEFKSLKNDERVLKHGHVGLIR